MATAHQLSLPEAVIHQRNSAGLSRTPADSLAGTVRGKSTRR